MIKTFKVIGIVIAMAALGFSMASCDIGSGSNPYAYRDSLVGTWLASEETGGYTMIFTVSMVDGGYVEFIDHPYHGSYIADWFVNRNELTIVGYSWTMHIGVYTFSIEGDTLTRRSRGSEEELVYTRQQAAQTN